MENLDLQTIENLETFKDLFDSAHDLIHIAHVNGQLIYINHAWERLLEFSQAEVRGKSIYEFVAGNDRETFIEYRNNIVRGNSLDKEVLVAFHTKTGKTVYIEGFVSARWDKGKPIYTRGIFRDVTLRVHNERLLKSTHEELREREFNLQQLLTHAPDAVIVIDAEGMITYWNPKAERMFGWTSQEVVGRKLSTTIIPPQYREAHDKGLSRYLSTGEARMLNKTVDITALDRSGREFYISLTISTTKQKGRTAFIAFLRDIDRQKRNELELEKKTAELEISNQDLEQFAHVASHDMKEPIRKIRLFTAQLKEETLEGVSEKAKTFINKIETAAERLTSMVEGILAYSSVNSEKREFETVDLNKIIGAVRTDLELLIEQKNAVITSAKLPRIRGISFLVYQLFYNVISNSLKFSRVETPPVIEITCMEKNEQPTQPALRNHHLVEIIVKDNGVGFSNEYSRRIFEKFSRLHASTQFEGTGLGLALCKKNSGSAWRHNQCQR